MEFVKYHGTGNDFIMVDDRASSFPADDYAYVAGLCHRRFGIGADGLILLREALSPAEAFTMVYYNADGRLGSFCGNGGRCTVAFAAALGIVGAGERVRFSAADGGHEALYVSSERIELKMNARGPATAADLPDGQTGYYLNTGSPHLMVEVEDVSQVDVESLGAALRYDPQFAVYGGVNVNFVEKVGPTELRVRTYERGVEAETLSCGTGVTASALWAGVGQEMAVHTPGGPLTVRSSADWQDIYLIGPAARVYAGVV